MSDYVKSEKKRVRWIGNYINMKYECIRIDFIRVVKQYIFKSC